MRRNHPTPNSTSPHFSNQQTRKNAFISASQAPWRSLTQLLFFLNTTYCIFPKVSQGRTWIAGKILSTSFSTYIQDALNGVLVCYASGTSVATCWWLLTDGCSLFFYMAVRTHTLLLSHTVSAIQHGQNVFCSEKHLRELTIKTGMIFMTICPQCLIELWVNRSCNSSLSETSKSQKLSKALISAIFSDWVQISCDLSESFLSNKAALRRSVALSAHANIQHADMLTPTLITCWFFVTYMSALFTVLGHLELVWQQGR